MQKRKRGPEQERDTIRIAAIDIGYENMALGVSTIAFFRGAWESRDALEEEIEDEMNFPHLERTSLRIRANGNFYDKYKEGSAVELVEGWLQDHWYLLGRVDLIVIEKQMTQNRGQSDRAGIVIETALKMALRREPLAPAFVVISPKSYKDDPKLGLRGTHHLNKQASIQLFRQQCPKDIYNDLEERNFGKMDDIADVYHMLAYTSRNIAKLMAESRVRSTHSSNVLQPDKARVYRQERETGFVHFEVVAEGGGSSSSSSSSPSGAQLTVDERNYYVHRHALEKKHKKQQTRARGRAAAKKKQKGDKKRQRTLDLAMMP